MNDLQRQAQRANRYLGKIYDSGFDLGGLYSNDMRDNLGPVVAHLPRAVIDHLAQEKPEYLKSLMHDDKEWNKFLKRHPEYKVQTRKRWDLSR